ncbi:DUF397 domain-containing protein [Streptomyces griseorubiginosus]|uniref:DUF397 domain-containing protein n=1 Tax=Streptomyces griseorubiginosus TaxID=67304 RepID=UPI003677F29F
MTTLNWQKSTYSEEASSCVEVATTPTGPHVTLRPAAWADFVPYAGKDRRLHVTGP